MGVEYRRYLIPRPNTFRPTPKALEELVEVLRRERWLLSPSAPERASLPFQTMRYYTQARNAGFFVKRGESYEPGPAENLRAYLAAHHDEDLLLSWPVESLAAAGLRYPLTPLPCADDAGEADCYYELQLHLSKDYVYHYSEVVDPFEEHPPVCACGKSLEHPEYKQNPFGDARLSANCPACGEPFDPTGLPCTARDIWTGEEHTIPGGVTYQFAVVIDCGKCFGETSMAFQAELKQQVESILGISTYEVEDAY